MNKENINAEDSIFLDDNKENVDTANNLGIKSIVVTSFEKMIKDLKDNGITVH